MADPDDDGDDDQDADESVYLRCLFCSSINFTFLGILMTRILRTKSAVRQLSYWRASLGRALID